MLSKIRVMGVLLLALVPCLHRLPGGERKGNALTLR